MTTPIDISAEDLVRYYRSIGIHAHVMTELEAAQAVSRDADRLDAKQAGTMKKVGTKKQAGKMKQGSPEAKEHMAKLRARRGKSKPEKSDDIGDQNDE